MNPQIRAQWCAALRSGEYQQGRQSLRDGDAYCCLGVLCDLAVKADIIGPPRRSQGGGSWWLYDGRIDYLPEAVQEWAGLNSGNPDVWYWEDKAARLGELNDNGKTFAEIAGLIDGGVS
jgi:hypothetical protein